MQDTVAKILYSTQWSTTHPGFLILLIDQSASTGRRFARAYNGEARPMCEVIAGITNEFLEELVKINTVFAVDNTPYVRPRADIAIVTYGNDTVSSAFGEQFPDRISLPDLDAHPLEIVERPDDDDPLDEETPTMSQHPIWIKAKAEGKTPMVAAFRRAWELAHQWAQEHPLSYPPVVVNISDGEATDCQWTGEFEAAGRAITNITTEDGAALLFNVHLTAMQDATEPQAAPPQEGAATEPQETLPVEYPAALGELPDTRYARMLFAISSPVPDTARPTLCNLVQRTLPPQARGLIYNVESASSVLGMLHFASIPLFTTAHGEE